MTIQDLGSLGELIAAVATVATLGYLAMQIRQYAKSTQAGAVQSSTDTDAPMLAIIQDPELTKIYLSGLSDYGSLDPVERARFGYTLGLMFGGIARHYENVTLGIVTEGYIRDRSWGILRLLETPGGSEFWHARSSSFPPEFREFVAREVNLQPPVRSKGKPTAA